MDAPKTALAQHWPFGQHVFRTLAFAAFISLGICLLLPSIGRSQVAPGRIRIPRANPPLQQSQVLTTPANENKKRILNDTEKLELRVAELEAKLDSQQKSFEAKLVAQQKTIDDLDKMVYARPQGYTKAFITLGNFKRLPDSDAISYWARN